MHPVEFSGMNGLYGKPKTWKDESCGPLPVFEGVDTIEGKQYKCFVCAWQPNAEDLKAIQSGQPVFVKLIIPEIVPLELYTLDPEGNSNNL